MSLEVTSLDWPFNFFRRFSVYTKHVNYVSCIKYGTDISGMAIGHKEYYYTVPIKQSTQDPIRQ